MLSVDLHSQTTCNQFGFFQPPYAQWFKILVFLFLLLFMNSVHFYHIISFALTICCEIIQLNIWLYLLTINSGLLYILFLLSTVLILWIDAFNLCIYVEQCFTRMVCEPTLLHYRNSGCRPEDSCSGCRAGASCGWGWGGSHAVSR